MIPMEHYSSQLQQLQSECQYVITVMIMALSRRYKFLLRKLEVEFNKFPRKLFSGSGCLSFSFGFCWVLVISFQKTDNKVTSAMATALRAHNNCGLGTGFWECFPVKCLPCCLKPPILSLILSL